MNDPLLRDLAHHTEVALVLRELRTGPPLTLPHVAIVPLHGDLEGPDAELLEEGIAAGHTRVEELPDGGVVGAVQVTHSGVIPLLLLDGEEIVGAKQNRVMNASFLILPGAAARVAVSCVERGRWRQDSPGFEAGGRTLTSGARAAKLRRVAQSVTTSGLYLADQRRVWREVDEYLDRSRVRSATSAYTDGVRARLACVEELLSAIVPAPDQVGVAAVRGGRLLGLDVLGSARLYRRAWKKVLRGIVAEVHRDEPIACDVVGVVDGALAALQGVPVTRRREPGCAETLHGTSNGLAIGAVVHDGQAFHLVAAGS
ncbi:MAG: hypothetical protein HYY06_11435 [Deltaproteobacteria bacterium]|nr:hypothetical protein [Deltaproteobacteria bacterium]